MTHATKDGEANSRLIAAAPELLEALKCAVGELEGWYGAAKQGIIKAEVSIGEFRRLERMKQAIAKAEGG